MSNKRKSKERKTSRRMALSSLKKTCGDIKKRLDSGKIDEARESVGKIRPTLKLWGWAVRISNSGNHLIKAGF